MKTLITITILIFTLNAKAEYWEIQPIFPDSNYQQQQLDNQRRQLELQRRQLDEMRRQNQYNNPGYGVWGATNNGMFGDTSRGWR